MTKDVILKNLIVYHGAMYHEKISYPPHPVRRIITGRSECAKNYFRLNSISNNIFDFEELYI